MYITCLDCFFLARFHAYDNHGPQMNAARSRTVYSSSPYERPHHLTSASTSVGARDNQIEIARANAWVKAYRAAAAEKATTVAAAAAVAAADATTRVIAGTPPDAATMARTHSDSAPRLSDKGETFLWGEVMSKVLLLVYAVCLFALFYVFIHSYEEESGSVSLIVSFPSFNLHSCSIHLF